MSIRSATAEDKIIGQKIRARRILANMSQEELGTKLGVTFQQVQKYEKGINRVSHTRLVKVAAAFNESVSFFFDEADQKPSKEGAMLQQAMSHPEIQRLALIVMAMKPEMRRALLSFVEVMETASAKK